VRFIGVNIVRVQRTYITLLPTFIFERKAKFYSEIIENIVLKFSNYVHGLQVNNGCTEVECVGNCG